MQVKFLTRGVASLALSAGIFIGCEDFMGHGSGSAGTQDATAALLGLATKDSAGCFELKTRCVRAHGMGKDSLSLDSSLVRDCIIDTAKADSILARRSEHNRGRHGHEDRDEGLEDSATAVALCDSLTLALARTDSTDSAYSGVARLTGRACHEAYEAKHRGEWTAPDSAAVKALCDSLTTALAAADPTAAGYSAQKLEALETCQEPLLMRLNPNKRDGHH